MIENPSKMNFAELLNFLTTIANRFSFVIRKNSGITCSEQNTLKLFNDYIIYKKEVSSWPGTQLYGGTAEIFCYTYNVEIANLILSSSTSLFDWLHPGKPEDLCFYRDNLPIFVSISHEHDCYFIEEIQ